MSDPDWEMYNHPSMLNQRITKCADALFPYGGKSWQDWCEMAMRKCMQDGVSPETLRDKRIGGRNIAKPRKITKVLYY